MVKKLISSHGDFALGIVVTVAVIKLFRWCLISGPLYEFIAKFTG